MRSRRFRPWLFASVLLWLAAGPACAQIAAPNAAGVSMGHLHFFVADAEAERAFWVRLGGTAVSFEGRDIVRMPGLLIAIEEREAAHAASVVDHVAFRVRSLDTIAALGFDVVPVEGYAGIASVMTPSGTRVELFEEGTATNVGFTPDYPDAVAERHNRPLALPLDSHHLHFYLPEDQVEAARDWYVERFGAVPGMRWRYLAADLPGMNLNFSAADAARVATRGQALDHIGFEIANLEAFCRGLEAQGVAFDRPFRRMSPALATAVLTRLHPHPRAPHRRHLARPRTRHGRQTPRSPRPRSSQPAISTPSNREPQRRPTFLTHCSQPHHRRARHTPAR